MSIKSQPHHKFVQTFVLAEQPNGYFVLNDIFRYLNDDEDEIIDDETAQPEVPLEEHPTPVESTLESHAVEDEVTTEAAANEVDEKLEEDKAAVVEEEDEAPRVTVSTTTAEAARDSETGSKDISEPTTSEEVPTEESVEQELTASAAASSAKTAIPAQPEAAPTKKTWASMVGGKAPAVPALPVQSPAASQTKAPKSAQATSTPKAAAEPSPTTASPSTSQNQNQSNGWQTADHGKKAKGPQAKAAPDGITLAYIKNVNDKIEADALRQTLEKHGHIKYFDVSRPKVSILSA